MADINELSYDGSAGEFIEIRTLVGDDVSNLVLEIYTKDGSVAGFDNSVSISSITPTSDGVHNYYVINTSLGDGPRDGLALVDDGDVVETVAWGQSKDISFSGGALDGTSVTSIGDPLAESSTGSLSKDENGNWVVGPPTKGSDNVCFTAGTLIRTDTGERPIEDLVVGDLVLTQDRGYQPIRWIGSSKHLAVGNVAPILIKKGALGNTRDLRVSPQHRMVVQGWMAELYFGVSEALATAKSLVNDHSILREEGGKVVYVHMLFDQHEIVWAEGAPSESFHPGAQGWSALSDDMRDEILTLFPQIADGKFENYGPSALVSIKHKEGQMLSAGGY